MIAKQNLNINCILIKTHPAESNNGPKIILYINQSLHNWLKFLALRFIYLHDVITNNHTN